MTWQIRGCLCCPTYGWTIPRPSTVSRSCLEVARCKTSSPKSLSSVGISALVVSHKEVQERSVATRVNCPWPPSAIRGRTECLSDNFDLLADTIAEHPAIARTTHFVIVPGPADITANSILPRRPILSSFASRLKSKVPKIHLGTNPCRIKFCDQEMVIFREDLMSRMLRNLVGVKPNVREDDLKRYVSDQAAHMPLLIFLHLSLCRLYWIKATWFHWPQLYTPSTPTLTTASVCILCQQRCVTAPCPVRRYSHVWSIRLCSPTNTIDTR